MPPPDEIPLGDGIAAGGEHVGMRAVDNQLAVDEHPLAVKNNQLKTSGSHLGSLFR